MNTEKKEWSKMSQVARLLYIMLVNFEGLDFLKAFELADVQDFHKRLQEIRALGYKLESRERSCENGGRTIPVRYWYIKPIIEGMYVRILDGTTTYPQGHHKHKGEVGIVTRIHNHKYFVTSTINGCHFGGYLHKQLAIVGEHKKGDTVTLTDKLFTVRGYNINNNTYVLSSEEGKAFQVVTPELISPALYF